MCIRDSLWGAQTAFRLPERLPDLPAAPRDLPEVERTAIAQRLDVQGARLAAEQTAKNLGLTRTTRFVNVLELGLMRNGSNEAPTQSAWEVGFELPLFDFGTARVARAESLYGQAVNRAAETAINARSEVREAYGAYRTAWDIAKHQRDEIVPLKRRIAEENLLRYNGMLIGVFELLADARSQIAGVNAAIEALRDFWLAQADLDMALVGKPSLSAAAAPAAPAAGHRGPGRVHRPPRAAAVGAAGRGVDAGAHGSRAAAHHRHPRRRHRPRPPGRPLRARPRGRRARVRRRAPAGRYGRGTRAGRRSAHARRCRVPAPSARPGRRAHRPRPRP